MNPNIDPANSPGDETPLGDADQSNPRRTTDSLDHHETHGGETSTSSDLGELTDAWDHEEEIVSLSSRYETQSAIGQGGMGTVVQAVDRRLNRAVAIKRLRDEFSRSRNAVRRFLTEARAVAALNHYNIVQIYDFGRDQDGHFIVMEYVEGESLADRLRQSGPLDANLAIEITTQICDALFVSHGQGIIHRDIKPANILLTTTGVPKLTDFGLARLDFGETSDTRHGATLGTLDFMPPEQRADAHSADARSDLWSLGATLYQLLTGQPPRVMRPDRLPREFVPVLMKALEDDPKARYQTAKEFTEALRSIQIHGAAEEIFFEKLGTGQCARCAEQNDPQRRFCAQCGAKLIEPCLGCKQDLPVWENYCGHCGNDQSQAVEKTLSQLSRTKHEIRSLKNQYQYEAALEKLAGLKLPDHSALADFNDWANEFQKQLSKERDQIRNRRDRLLATAQKRISAGDDREAMEFLEQIPESVRDREVNNMLAQVKGRIDEADRLSREIGKALRENLMDHLLPKVKQYAKLRPSDERAKRLIKKLQIHERRRRAPQPSRSGPMAIPPHPQAGPPRNRPVTPPVRTPPQSPTPRPQPSPIPRPPSGNPPGGKIVIPPTVSGPTGAPTQLDPSRPVVHAPVRTAPPPPGPLRPHRAGMIMMLSLIGWVTCFLFGIVAWKMANEDLRAMAVGRMDPSGRQKTVQARSIAIAQVFIAGGLTIAWLIWNAIMFFVYYV